MKYSIKRALAMFIALLMAMPSVAWAEEPVVSSAAVEAAVGEADGFMLGDDVFIEDQAGDDVSGAGDDAPGDDAPGEGEAEEGQAEEGQAEEGQAEEGQAEEGQAEEGQAEEGQAEEGQAEEGQAEEGQAEEGQAEEGQAEEGQAEEGQAEEGQAEEGGAGEEGEPQVDTTPEGLTIIYEETPAEEAPEQAEEPEQAEAPAEGEAPAEAEASDEAEESAEAAQAVRVAFDVVPDGAVIAVRPAATEAEATPEAIPAEADGSYLLFPGEYVYTAEAEGYASAQDVPFTVAGEALTIAVALTAVEVEEPTEVGFEQTEVVKGVAVTVRAKAGAFPEDAQLSVKYVPIMRQKKVEAAIGDVRDEDVNVAVSYTFDIKVIDPATGEELQPTEGFGVAVSFALSEAADENLDTAVYHVTEADGALTAEKLETDVDAEGETVTAAAESFSLYTVEFTYNNLQYVMKGDTAVALSEILAEVGLTGEVTAVSVSNAGLFSASDESGAWVVTAHQPFHTEEWMKVTINGMAYEITVTDDTPIYEAAWVEGDIQGEVEFVRADDSTGILGILNLVQDQNEADTQRSTTEADAYKPTSLAQAMREIAADIASQDTETVEDVTVTIKAETLPDTSDTPGTEQAQIKSAASEMHDSGNALEGLKLDFIDLTMLQTVNGGTPTRARPPSLSRLRTAKQPC